MGGDQHAGGAEAALEGAARGERALQRLHARRLEHAFEGAHRPVDAAVRQRQAGAHRHAVDLDRAGAAHALVAAALGGGQVQLVAQDGQQGRRQAGAHVGDGCR